MIEDIFWSEESDIRFKEPSCKNDAGEIFDTGDHYVLILRRFAALPQK